MRWESKQKLIGNQIPRNKFTDRYLTDRGQSYYYQLYRKRMDLATNSIYKHSAILTVIPAALLLAIPRLTNGLVGLVFYFLLVFISFFMILVLNFSLKSDLIHKRIRNKYTLDGRFKKEKSKFYYVQTTYP